MTTARTKPPSDPLSQSKDLIRQIFKAKRTAPPIEILDQLISLSLAHPEVKQAVLGSTEKAFDRRASSLAPCWMALVCEALGREGVLVVLKGSLGADSPPLDETIPPILARHAVEILDEILAAFEDADELEDEIPRLGLYGALESIIVGDDQALKERLREFVLKRFEMEKDHPMSGPGLAAEPLSLLAYLGYPGTGEMLREARELVEEDDPLQRELNDVQCVLDGDEFLSFARDALRESWRDTFQHLVRMFVEPADPEEVRQSYERLIAAMLEEKQKEFRKKMGRDPGPDDALFTPEEQIAWEALLREAGKPT